MKHKRPVGLLLIALLFFFLGCGFGLVFGSHMMQDPLDDPYAESWGIDYTFPVLAMVFSIVLILASIGILIQSFWLGYIGGNIASLMLVVLSWTIGISLGVWTPMSAYAVMFVFALIPVRLNFAYRKYFLKDKKHING